VESDQQRKSEDESPSIPLAIDLASIDSINLDDAVPHCIKG
jgi:hypothetical protein